MARISGVNIPTDKRVVVSLTYIYGIGAKTASVICQKANIANTKRIKDLSEDALMRIRKIIENDLVVEGDLRRKVAMDLRRLLDLGCYRGLRHRKNLPVRGQRTSTNASTRKGRSVPIAGKKK